MTQYKLKCWDDEYVIDADLTQASAPILVDGNSTPYQTADFRHRENEMRVGIAAYLYRDTPDHDADFNDVAKLSDIGTRCDCGKVTGQECSWEGDEADTVLVEWMPEHLRASHEAAGNRGEYPHNGAIRVRCERGCAVDIVEADPDWAAVVEE